MHPFDQILFIGPHHKNHRGGIGAVLEIYSKNIRPFHFIPTMSYRNKFYEFFFFTGSLLKLNFTLLTKKNIKLIHIHGAKDGSVVRKAIVCFIAKKIYSKKIVYHIHSGTYEECYKERNSLYKSLCRFLVNNSEAVIILSDKWFGFLQTNFRVKKSLVLKNPVEKRVDGVLPRSSSAFTNFLFLGKIADHKGIFDLVQLISEEQEKLRGKCKLFVGGNDEVERLKNIIAEKNIGDLVEYIGWTRAKQKDEHFRACDYFILPTYYEGMPMTILESFSYGKPVISTPVGSIPEILKDNYNGFLFEPGDMAALKKLITKVIEDPSLSPTLCKNALYKASGFYPEAITNELKNLYAEII
ncbi:MAG: glycosyltransferase family 4 protein [Bacteroidota bacterium]|nr:glycosyltransferase family 4 protein [Bacteroidota bacterium]